MVLTPRMAHRFSRKQDSSQSSTKKPNGDTHKENEENHNIVVYKKMELIIEQMQDEHSGVPVRTVKSFMSKIPSVFTGADLTAWLMKNLDVEDQIEALHLAHLIAAHGYLFPIDDHILTVRNDNTYYRFQTPCFWPSRGGDPENNEYAVYLCKRTMQNKQRLELADYEAENLARLQKMFSRKWEFIFMQAEAQAKVDKKRDKLERKVLDSQERAFWDVHRPAPGCVNTTEVDIKKACKMNKPVKAVVKQNYNVPGGRISPSVSEVDLRNPNESVRFEVQQLQSRLDRRRIKVSKVAESFISYFEQYAEFDSFMAPPDPSNPWISDNTEFWEQESGMKEIPQRRVKRWGFSIYELLKDPAGREHFAKFLEKEFSAENLKFWEACKALRFIPEKDVCRRVHEIYSEFLASGAPDPVNIDCRVSDSVKKKVENTPDRYVFEEAEEHIFHLMKSDSYGRYARSDMYKEFLGGAKKKIKKRFASEVRKLRAAAAAVAIAGQVQHMHMMSLNSLNSTPPATPPIAQSANSSIYLTPPPLTTTTTSASNISGGGSASSAGSGASSSTLLRIPILQQHPHQTTPTTITQTTAPTSTTASTVTTTTPSHSHSIKHETTSSA